MSRRPKIAFISCGGSISSEGADSLDFLEYTDGCRFLDAQTLFDRFPELAGIVDAVPVQFIGVGSSAIGDTHWLKLLDLIDKTARSHPDICGIVIPHGTATLEETAYFLSLTVKINVPVVLVGAQRPPSALSSDAGANLFNAVRTVISTEARAMGVLIVMNDEIHAARDATKTSTLRLQTFRSLDVGILGYVDSDGVYFYRQPMRRSASNSEFDVRGLASLPRVGICYSYAGADGAVIDALVATGAKGIVSAGFAPGLPTPSEREALLRAIDKDVAVVQSSRAWGGRVAPRRRMKELGIVAADNLNPQKARILLMLALTRSAEVTAIQKYFHEY